MSITLAAHLEESTNEALFIARELGYPVEELGIDLLLDPTVDPRHLQKARKYQKLYKAADFILMKVRS